jgi:hypothetical protein
MVYEDNCIPVGTAGASKFVSWTLVWVARRVQLSVNISSPTTANQTVITVTVTAQPAPLTAVAVTKETRSRSNFTLAPAHPILHKHVRVGVSVIDCFENQKAPEFGRRLVAWISSTALQSNLKQR